MPKTYKKLKKRGGSPIPRRNISRAERAYSSLPRPSYRRPIYSRPLYQNFDDDAMDIVQEEDDRNNDVMYGDTIHDNTIDYDEEEDIPRINLEQDCEKEERSPGEFESGISYETLIPSQTVKLSDGRCYSFQDVVNLYDRAGSRANFKSPYTRVLFTDADYDIVMALLARGIQPDDNPETPITGGYRKKNKKSSKKNKITTKKRKTIKRKRS